jgi:hypothetical protein
MDGDTVGIVSKGNNISNEINQEDVEWQLDLTYQQEKVTNW